MNFEDLNDKQQEAILYNQGPLLILAGAGSGKTRVLTNKIAHLLINLKVDSSNILAITFTNKAAKEMKERLFKLAPSYARNMQVSTFHSFGLRIISENYENLNLDKNFAIIDADDSGTLIKKILRDLNIDSEKYNYKNIKSLISSAKNELMGPERYASIANDHFSQITLKVYQRYAETLIKNNTVDFDDLLMLPIKLFENNKNILETYQERFKYIFIDEYQDTNTAQYTLTKMIASKYQNICVVGDNDQSIYSWRGANFQNILNFEKDYPNAKTILLEENYRSTSNILKAANNVIKNNSARHEKNLWTKNDSGDLLTRYEAFDEKDEASYIIDTITKNNLYYDEVAVLYRTNAQSRTVEEAFLRANIPYKIVGSYAFYSRKEIKDLLAYLRIINNPSDEISLLRTINYPKRGIGDKTIKDLVDKAKLMNVSIFDAINSGKELEYKNIILSLQASLPKVTLTEFIDLVLDKTKIRQELVNEKSLEADIRLENLDEFKSITSTFEKETGILDLGDFLNQIALLTDLNETKETTNQVTLMTVHAAKGLEFDYVFIIGLEEEIFPHLNSIYENDALEEERRLCYVAITRARKHVYLINAKQRMLFGKTKSNQVSRFLMEIDKSLINNVNNPIKEPKLALNKEICYNNEEQDYQAGDHVYHETFNEGIVVAVNGNIINVAFKMPYGLKSLMKNHKSIRKV